LNEFLEAISSTTLQLLLKTLYFDWQKGASFRRSFSQENNSVFSCEVSVAIWAKLNRLFTNRIVNLHLNKLKGLWP
jgi:hypothetical protein